MPADIFISYSRKDSEFVAKLGESLTHRGIRVWIDQGSIIAGDAWRLQIVEAIRNCRVFLLVLSPNSTVSDNVVKELSMAESNHKKIIPVLYKPVDIPETMEYQLSGLQYQAFDSGNYATNFERLLQALARLGVENQAEKIKPIEAIVSAPARSAPRNMKPILIGSGIVGVVVVCLCMVTLYSIFGPQAAEIYTPVPSIAVRSSSSAVSSLASSSVSSRVSSSVALSLPSPVSSLASSSVSSRVSSSVVSSSLPSSVASVVPSLSISSRPSSASPKPSGFVSDVVMALDTQGANKDPVSPTTTFKPNDTFHAITKTNNAPANMIFRASWFAVDVGTVALPNSLIDETELSTSGSRNIDFTLTPNDKWPIGTYRVEIYVNGTLDTIRNFSVR